MKFKHLSLLTSIPVHFLGVFSVKLSHPMMAIPEHETLDSEEVNGRYNWRSGYLFPCDIRL